MRVSAWGSAKTGGRDQGQSGFATCNKNALVIAYEKQREGPTKKARERFKQPSPIRASEHSNSYVIVPQHEKIPERLVSEVKPTIGKY